MYKRWKLVHRFVLSSEQFKKMPARVLIALIGILASPAIVRATTLVEIMLVDKLDEPRGFCLDILGSQQKATPERGLQAHTCYSYQGKIAVDQGFDADLIGKGEFRMPGFGVCMTLKLVKEGSSIALENCDKRTEQGFELKAAGQIVPRADPQLCLTVAGGASVPGGGGRPTHLIRKLTVERCSAQRTTYQTWRFREKSD